MKTNQILLAGGLAFCAAGPLLAQNAVLNGDFSSNGALFTNFPGYPGGPNPAAIDNWTKVSAGGNFGINGVGISNPFGPLDKSATTYYAFLQSPGTVAAQDVILQPDTTYDISFLAGNRNGNAAAEGSVIVEDASETYYDSDITNWGTSAFQLVSAQFTTPATIDGTVTITLYNDSPAGDNTVCYSNISIAEFVPDDPDGDGIATADENSGAQNAYDGAATNPNEPDSDFDGIDDMEEGIAGGGADGYVTNPNAADSDGDGFDDLLEITQGTSPIDNGDTPSSLANGDYITNGDFSANDEAFTTFPGAGNIESWNQGGAAGINGGDSTAGLPFADNGALDGAVAYIQQPGFLSQQVFGMTPGQTLYLVFDYNTRNAAVGSNSATLEVTATGLGSPLFSQVVDVPVGGSNPFYTTGLISFSAPSNTFELKFEWIPVGADRTVLLDNIQVLDALPPETPQWDTNLVTADDQGGTGTWDTVTANFWDGTSNVLWPATSTGDDDVIFDGTAGTVTIDAAGITANELDFQVGGYTVTGGMLTLDGSNAGISVATGATTTFQSLISAPGTPVAKGGGGTLDLEADVTVDSFRIAPDGGTVNVPSGVTLGTAAATAGNGFGVRLQSNTTLMIDGTIGSLAGDFGGFSGDGGWTATLNPGGVLDIAGSAHVGWNSIGTLNLNGGSSSFGGNVAHKDSGNATISILDGTHTITGNLGADCNGDGSGTTIDISGGLIMAGTVGFNVGTTVGAPLGVNDLTVTLTGGVVETDRVALTRGPATTAGDNIFDLIFDGGTLRAAPGGASSTLIDGDLGMDTLGPVDLFVTIEGGGATIDTNGEDKSVDQIMDGNGALAKTGAGTLLLTADNTYSGGTTVSEGCLSLADINAIPTVSSVTVAAGAGFGGIVGPSNLSDADIQSIVDTTNWPVSGGSLVIDTNGADVTVAANITGDIGLIKKGGGDLVLTGTNTYTGPTVIEEGTIDGAGSGIEITDASYDAVDQDFTITFTSAGNVDVYRSPNLLPPLTEIGTNVPSGTFTDTNATDAKSFYILVPTGTTFP
jgi:autotransporter-associated beta strand protein